MRNHGYGFILDFKLNGNISKKMMLWLYSKFRPGSLTIVLEQGEELEITEDVVQAMYGFPNKDMLEAP